MIESKQASKRERRICARTTYVFATTAKLENRGYIIRQARQIGTGKSRGSEPKRARNDVGNMHAHRSENERALVCGRKMTAWRVLLFDWPAHTTRVVRSNRRRHVCALFLFSFIALGTAFLCSFPSSTVGVQPLYSSLAVADQDANLQKQKQKKTAEANQKPYRSYSTSIASGFPSYSVAPLLCAPTLIVCSGKSDHYFPRVSNNREIQFESDLTAGEGHNWDCGLLLASNGTGTARFDLHPIAANQAKAFASTPIELAIKAYRANGYMRNF
ncbi:uncharacterized protein UHOD_12223 [Ustilago sp. UG-2017b]|nr:uncharacterized protein UHOD_12223 [Ustilago sp. UG-2017b]